MNDIILNSNKREVKNYFKANYETEPRKPKGLYVFGNVESIIKDLDRLGEIVALDCNEDVSLPWAKLYGNAEQTDEIGVALVF